MTALLGASLTCHVSLEPHLATRRKSSVKNKQSVCRMYHFPPMGLMHHLVFNTFPRRGK